MSADTASPNDNPQKSIFIIAGPNGAGKTTFAGRFLPSVLGATYTFINADDIARSINPSDVEAVALLAGKTTLRRINGLVAGNESFAFESTLSGRAYAGHISRWREQGYEVFLNFLSLPNVEAAIERVQLRVSQGGHNIPPDIIRRRFDAGIKNFHHLYKPLVSGWIWYDNSGSDPKIQDKG